uniref:Uncharacterized protein n=1 Tax=Setaria viridis TaxID=4556 RepID=A0A4U6SRA2_SETVI|nr:hypothetical protein SEVIR_9G020750v2 [Setaria viridis]
MIFYSFSWLLAFTKAKADLEVQPKELHVDAHTLFHWGCPCVVSLFARFQVL